MKNRVISVLVVVAFAIVAAGLFVYFSGPHDTLTSIPGSTSGSEATAQNISVLLNQERAQKTNNNSFFKESALLDKAAALKIQYVRSEGLYTKHVSDLLSEVGYSSRTGYAIFYEKATPDQDAADVVKAILQGEGIEDKIVNGDYDEVGVSVSGSSVAVIIATKS